MARIQEIVTFCREFQIVLGYHPVQAFYRHNELLQLAWTPPAGWIGLFRLTSVSGDIILVFHNTEI